MEYTEVKRDDRIDMDPYYYAPEVPSSFMSCSVATRILTHLL